MFDTSASHHETGSLAGSESATSESCNATRDKRRWKSVSRRVRLRRYREHPIAKGRSRIGCSDLTRRTRPMKMSGTHRRYASGKRVLQRTSTREMRNAMRESRTQFVERQRTLRPFAFTRDRDSTSGVCERGQSNASRPPTGRGIPGCQRRRDRKAERPRGAYVPPNRQPAPASDCTARKKARHGAGPLVDRTLWRGSELAVASGGLDVARLLALGALGHFEADLLAFLQRS